MQYTLFIWSKNTIQRYVFSDGWMAAAEPSDNDDRDDYKGYDERWRRKHSNFKHFSNICVNPFYALTCHEFDLQKKISENIFLCMIFPKYLLTAAVITSNIYMIMYFLFSFWRTYNNLIFEISTQKLDVSVRSFTTITTAKMLLIILTYNKTYTLGDLLHYAMMCLVMR